MEKPAHPNILNYYSPLNYRSTVQFGPGAIITPSLSSLEKKVWDAVLKYQDTRDDPGQGEIVTYYAITLSKIYKLPRQEQEVAVLAAILHDTGYALMKDVVKNFGRSLALIKQGGNAAKEGKEFFRGIRLEHQKLSVQIAREILGTYPYTDEVCTIILDHDTRDNPPTDVGRFMWDADILWRVTVPGLKAFERGYSSIFNTHERYDHVHAQVKRECFLLERSYEIARLEFAHSLLQLAKESEIPEYLKAEYNSEMKFLLTK